MKAVRRLQGWSGRCGRQRGHIMVVLLFFFPAVMLALWIMYDSGQVNIEKMRLQNTADNAAYSAAVVVARDMNFIAYTNRAMVANQVAIAQAVGVSSWMHMIRRAAQNLATVTSWVPGVNVVTNSISQGAAAGSSGVDMWAMGAIMLSDSANGLLSASQVAFHATAMAAAAEIADRAATDNDADVTHLLSGMGTPLITVASLAGWWQETIGHAQHQVPGPHPTNEGESLALRRFDEFEAAVNQSRDPFTQRRSYNWWTYRPPTGHQVEIRKYGGSEFFRRTSATGDEFQWNWAAMDTVSIWGRACLISLGVSVCNSWSETPRASVIGSGLPLGWGAAHALDTDHDYGDFFTLYRRPPGYGSRPTELWGNGAWRNRWASEPIDLPNTDIFGGSGDNRLASIRGLRSFYDFRNDGFIDVGPPVTVLVAKADTHLQVQKNWPDQFTDYEIEDDFRTEAAGGMLQARMAALAKAEPYFARAHDLWTRRDGRFEHGNLYNPFWQVRLTETSDEERAAAILIASGVSP
jgi:hypothetical protein